MKSRTLPILEAFLQLLIKLTALQYQNQKTRPLPRNHCRKTAISLIIMYKKTCAFLYPFLTSGLTQNKSRYPRVGSMDSTSPHATDDPPNAIANTIYDPPMSHSPVHSSLSFNFLHSESPISLPDGTPQSSLCQTINCIRPPGEETDAGRTPK